MKKVKRIFQITAVVLLLYLISFGCFFNILSYPVRNQHDWLGPAKRFNPQVTDIGKVYHYDSKNQTLYSIYQPLCWAWLRLNSLS